MALGVVWLRGKPWSVEQERELRALVGEGKEVDVIAVAMGKTRVAVKGKMSNLCFKFERCHRCSEGGCSNNFSFGA